MPPLAEVGWAKVTLSGADGRISELKTLFSEAGGALIPHA